MKSRVAKGIRDMVTRVSCCRTDEKFIMRRKGSHFRWRKCPSKGPESNRNVAFRGMGQSIKDQNTARALNATQRQ